MTWHYQIIQYPDHVELVEAIDFAEPLEVQDGEDVEMVQVRRGFTEPLWVAEDVEELVHDLKLILKDIKKYPSITPEEANLT